MRINRLELLGLLKIVSPALAGPKHAVQEMCCVWFDGQHISGFNDVLGVQVDFKTEFTGGMLGDKLIGVLERSTAKEIDFQAEGEDAVLKIGNASIKLTRRPIEDWFWSPEVPGSAGYEVTKQFREAVDLVLMSVGSSAAVNPEQRGVTIIQNGKGADLYSTDAVSLSRAYVSTGNRTIIDRRVVLPTVLCEQFKMLKGSIELRFDDGAVYCLAAVDPVGRKAESGEVRRTYGAVVFSRLIDDEEPVDFEDVVSTYEVPKDGGAPVPSQLKRRAERAMVVLGDHPLEVRVEDGYLHLDAQTPYGEVHDRLKFPDHPDAELKIDASLLNRALEGREAMVLSENGVVMTGPADFLHIIGSK
ncbi:MAG: hypothetical protein KGO96_10240 [Elusimicrobia bacterium]|nr:hypothetical protein [Elusimicrobiota bacterium]